MNFDRVREYDQMYKVVIIGDSAVGKTCILQRFAEDTFQESFISTIGVDFKTKTIHVGNSTIKLQLWDTAGQERFRVICNAYYRDAQGILIVYDVTRGDTFVSTKRWLEEARKNCSEDVPIILVGNKCDAPNRVIAFKDQEDYAKAVELPFFETSAKANININEVFNELARRIIENKKSEITDEKKEPIQVGNSSNHPRLIFGGKHKCC